MTTFFQVLDKFFSDYVYLKLTIFATLLVQGKCQSPSLTGPTSGVLDSSVHLICTLPGSSALVGLLPFNKEGLLGSPCIVSISACSQFQAEANYTCGCVSGQTREFYLNISSLRKLDDDTWSCSFNTVSSNTINLSVYYAPEINSSSLTEKDVIENSSPDIDCSSGLTAGNPSNTSYTWTGPGSYNKSGSVLDRNVSRSQGGPYTCTARNSAGLSDSAQVNIKVQYAPVISSSFQDNKTVTENSSLNIDCSSSLTAGNPSDTSYTWTGPGGYSKSGSVLDRNLSRSQGGSYTCTARNSAGLTDSAQVNINVFYVDVPVLTISPQEVMENASVHLKCEVSSNPTVQMTISNLDNTDLVDREMTNTRQINIDRAQCLHNGTFQCVVNNRALSRSETASKELSVLCSPRFDFRKNHNITVAAEINETAQLLAEVIANPFPNFTWGRLEGDDLFPINRYTLSTVHSSKLKSILQINVTSSKDYGQYAVKVQNKEGTTLLRYNLTAKDLGKGTLNVAAIAGGITAALLVIIIVAGIFILYKRGANGYFCLSKEKRNGDMSSGGRIREDFVMGESVTSSVVGGGSGEQLGGASGGMSDVYAVVDKKPKPSKPRRVVYSQVKAKRAAKPGDIYENSSPGQFLVGADANTYANDGFVGDDQTSDEIADAQNPQPQTGRDADGCMYVGIDFGNHKPGKVIIGKEKGSYVDIAHGKVGPPPPPDEDD